MISGAGIDVCILLTTFNHTHHYTMQLLGDMVKELRKLLLWLTLEGFRRKFVQKQIDWTGRAGSLSQKRLKWGVILPQSGRGF